MRAVDDLPECQLCDDLAVVVTETHHVFCNEHYRMWHSVQMRDKARVGLDAAQKRIDKIKDQMAEAERLAQRQDLVHLLLELEEPDVPEDNDRLGVM